MFNRIQTAYTQNRVRPRNRTHDSSVWSVFHVNSSRPLKVYAVCIPIHCPKIAPVPGICKALHHDSLTPSASYLASPHGDDEPARCDASEVVFI